MSKHTGRGPIEERTIEAQGSKEEEATVVNNMQSRREAEKED